MFTGQTTWRWPLDYEWDLAWFPDWFAWVLHNKAFLSIYFKGPKNNLVPALGWSPRNSGGEFFKFSFRSMELTNRLSGEHSMWSLMEPAAPFTFDSCRVLWNSHFRGSSMYPICLSPCGGETVSRWMFQGVLFLSGPILPASFFWASLPEVACLVLWAMRR